MKIAAVSIARPLMVELAAHPFIGWILGRFERACNLADVEGRVIALTFPEIGNGPFSIVVAGPSDLFESLAIGQPARVAAGKLALGSWQIDLISAKIWEPQIIHFAQPRYLHPAITNILTSYTAWPHPVGVNSTINNRLAEAAAQLNRVILEPEGYKRSEKIAQAVGQLAGLGSGLTPAGDDYLVGVMAALWLTGQKALLPRMAHMAARQTTTLSAAFLKAAARGEFMEPWHALAQALSAGETGAFSQAIEQVAQFGASSGRDALAGFATTLLSLVNHEAPAQ
ncbi:MAG: DUF2877 domain-containing protein [Chloroflexi bacterium]|nr:DUF2877 domain-containing protein [Chloroflexota bacterium]